CASHGEEAGTVAAVVVQEHQVAVIGAPRDATRLADALVVDRAPASHSRPALGGGAGAGGGDGGGRHGHRDGQDYSRPEGHARKLLVRGSPRIQEPYQPKSHELQSVMRLPSSSQWAATFLLGCTRGGSPGILGVPSCCWPCIAAIMQVGRACHATGY